MDNSTACGQLGGQEAFAVALDELVEDDAALELVFDELELLDESDDPFDDPFDEDVSLLAAVLLLPFEAALLSVR